MQANSLVFTLVALEALATSETWEGDTVKAFDEDSVLKVSTATRFSFEPKGSDLTIGYQGTLKLENGLSFNEMQGQSYFESCIEKDHSKKDEFVYYC